MKKKRKRILILVPVASMGDIAFLLIIFFVICSNFAKDSIKVAPPQSIDVTRLEQYPMSVAIDKEGKIFFQGDRVANPEALEALIRYKVEGKTEVKARTVLLYCDKSVRKDVFEPVIEAIAEAGGQIAAVGQEPPEN
jgi:biopolymer transport protein ExbD